MTLTSKKMFKRNDHNLCAKVYRVTGQNLGWETHQHYFESIMRQLSVRMVHRISPDLFLSAKWVGTLGVSCLCPFVLVLNPSRVFSSLGQNKVVLLLLLLLLLRALAFPLTSFFGDSALTVCWFSRLPVTFSSFSLDLLATGLGVAGRTRVDWRMAWMGRFSSLTFASDSSIELEDSPLSWLDWLSLLRSERLSDSNLTLFRLRSLASGMHENVGIWELFMGKHGVSFFDAQ